MSRYEIELDRLGAQLASIVADPAVVASATDTELVNRTRLAVRWWCRRTLHDVVPVDDDQVAGRPGLVDLARNPLGVLHRLFDLDPTPVVLPTAEIDPSAAEHAHSQLQLLINAVEFAMYEWDIADPASKPSGDRAWATVANVAAVAEAQAALDEDLHARSTAATAAVGRARDCWEIGVAAQYVRHVASGAAQLPALPLRSAPQSLRPVLVRGLRDVPHAMHNLAALIEAASHLGPGVMAALAASQARSLDTLAVLLVKTTPLPERAARQRLAADLRQLAEELLKVRAAARRLRSIDPDDPRPAIQMRELQAALRDAAARPREHLEAEFQEAVFASLRAALLIPRAMAGSTEAHVRDGRWLEPMEGDKLRWATVSTRPAVLEAAARAGVQSRAVADALPPTRLVPTPHRTPCETLAPALRTARPVTRITI